MQEEADVGVTYEEALRVIGRHLESEPVYYASILEVNSGFTVRYQLSRQTAQVKTVEFPNHRVRDLSIFQTAGRGSGTRKQRHSGLWKHSECSRQEFLRALGCMLDQSQASALALDELPEEIRISYVRPRPDRPLEMEKCSLVISDDDVQALVNDARLKRSHRITLVTI